MIKGTITSINISKEKGVVKTPVDTAICKCDHGIVGDAHAGNWHRQISLLAQESIDIMTEMGVEDLTPGAICRKSDNKDICLYELPVGTRLQIGETIQEVTQIGKECHKGCAHSAESRQVHHAYPGNFTKVIKEGTIHIGDTISVL